jgi:hypothetical protein
MPQPQPKGVPSTEGLQWAVISDFTPGIISNSNFAYGTQPTGAVPFQKPGAAQVAGTQNCIALPNGGLSPLPGVKETLTYPDQLAPSYMNGALAYGPIGQSAFFPQGGDEILWGSEAYDGTSRQFNLYGYQESSSSYFSIFEAGGPDVQLGLQACTIILTVFNPTDATGLTSGLPRVVFSYYFMATAGNTEETEFYPPWASTTRGSTAIDVDFSVPAWVLGHQNRIVYLVRPIMDWAQPIGGPAQHFSGAEFYDYSDPPNTVVIGDQEEYFVQENPTAHGAWGSISASELFLVRDQGGGYVISGDLNAPTVTRLPGVTSTNGAVQIAGQTPIGFVYGSQNNGVWVWNGGNTSTKISAQLNDDFFGLTYTYPTAGPFFNFNTLGDLIYCPNGYVYSITMNSWWRWGTSDGAQPFAWFWPTYDGQGMWCWPQSIQNAALPSVYKVSRLTPATEYTWESYPMPFTNEDQVLVRVVSVRAQGEGTIQIFLRNTTGQSTITLPVNFTIASPGSPQVLRQQAAAQGSDITLSLTSTGLSGGPAPVIYDIRIGWERGNELPAVPV